MADSAKKPGLAAIAESYSKKPAKAVEKRSAMVDEDDEEYGTSIDELYDAIKSGDREGFASAFRAAVGSCK